jgi:hypothetical protein
MPVRPHGDRSCTANKLGRSCASICVHDWMSVKLQYVFKKKHIDVLFFHFVMQPEERINCPHCQRGIGYRRHALLFAFYSSRSQLCIVQEDVSRRLLLQSTMLLLRLGVLEYIW